MTESQKSKLESVVAGEESLPSLRAITSDWPLGWFNYARGAALHKNPATAVKLIILRAERLDSIRLHDLKVLTWRRRALVLAVAAVIVTPLVWRFF